MESAFRIIVLNKCEIFGYYVAISLKSHMDQKLTFLEEEKKTFFIAYFRLG